MSEFRPIGDEELSLSLAEARTLPEAELRERFVEIAVDGIDMFGDDLASGFPRRPHLLTRARILAALMEHAHFFDPHGGHPIPPMPDLEP